MSLASEIYEKINSELGKVIIGQEEIITQMMVGMFGGGHVLVEGVPGTGKTLLVRGLARLLGYSFKRIQFTPDLMPSDITGTNVFDQKGSNFYFKKGPVFTNILLADEINRTPPKTQSALIESMEEKQVTIDGVGYRLPDPFVVFATQNPLEQQGTYPLPEAQLDRFMLKVIINHPPREQEREILERYVEGQPLHDLEETDMEVLDIKEPLGRMWDEVKGITVEWSIIDYVMDLIRETRQDKDLYLGASSRAAIHLLTAARILAALRGSDFVTPDEVKEMGGPVLRHRVITTPEAEVEGLTTDQILEGILTRVKVPR